MDRASFLSGWAQSADDVDKAVSVASQYAGNDANVANLITVGGAQQVALKVTVAEVSRETVKQLGIDLSASLSSGGLSTSLINQPGLGGASSVVSTGSAHPWSRHRQFLARCGRSRRLNGAGAMRTLAKADP